MSVLGKSLEPEETLAQLDDRHVGRYTVRPARREDADGARSVILDTFYHVFGHGYIPRWHADVIDMDRAYFGGHPRVDASSNNRHLLRRTATISLRLVAIVKTVSAPAVPPGRLLPHS